MATSVDEARRDIRITTRIDGPCMGRVGHGLVGRDDATILDENRAAGDPSGAGPDLAGTNDQVVVSRFLFFLVAEFAAESGRRPGEAAVDVDPSNMCCRGERLAVEHEEIGVASGLDRADPVVYTEDSGGVRGDGFEGLSHGQARAAGGGCVKHQGGVGCVGRTSEGDGECVQFRRDDEPVVQSVGIRPQIGDRTCGIDRDFVDDRGFGQRSCEESGFDGAGQEEIVPPFAAEFDALLEVGGSIGMNAERYLALKQGREGFETGIVIR